MNDTTVMDRREKLTQAMARVAGHDRAALKVVYDLTSTKLLGVIIRIVRDREQAQDILQDVYLKVWNRAGRYDSDRASPITWLCTIARNTAIDALRREGRRQTMSDDGIEDVRDDTPLADELLCTREEHDTVRRCLDDLQADHRRSIRLAFFDGLSHSELAERIGVPLGTTKSWIRRGLASLKGCLDRD